MNQVKNKIKTITPCLWFDTQAEEAANLYTSIFKNAKIKHISRYGEEGKEIHGQQAGTVMTVSFQLEGWEFIALNGGPQFNFTEAISFQVSCESQEEIDHFWKKLTAGGEEGQCGWLKDKFGVSWQIVPAILPELLSGSDTKKTQSVTRAFLQMKKFDIEKLKQAYYQA